MPELTDELRARLIEQIRSICLDELDQSIGQLKAELVLGRLMPTLGAAMYNQGLRDAQSYMQTRLIDMEIDLQEPETDDRDPNESDD